MSTTTVIPEWFGRLADWANRDFAYLKNPFSCEGYACVTEGRVLAAIRGDFAVPPKDETKLDGIRDLLTVAPEIYEFDLAKLKAFVASDIPSQCLTCKGTGQMRCANCKGRKTFTCTCTECDNEHDATCNECDGQGQAACECESARYPVKAFGEVINARLLHQAISGMPDGNFRVVKVQQKKEDNPAIVLIGEDWRVCIMPMRDKGEGLREFAVNELAGTDV